MPIKYTPEEEAKAVDDAPDNRIPEAIMSAISHNSQMTEKLHAILARSGNKIVRATVDRGKDKLITGITMHITDQ